MNKISALIKEGWVIDEIRYDQNQEWFYVHCIHETQEVSGVSGSSDASLTDAVDMMYREAIATTPKWYTEQLRRLT